MALHVTLPTLATASTYRQTRVQAVNTGAVQCHVDQLVQGPGPQWCVYVKGPLGERGMRFGLLYVHDHGLACTTPNTHPPPHPLHHTMLKLTLRRSPRSSAPIVCKRLAAEDANLYSPPTLVTNSLYMGALA